MKIDDVYDCPKLYKNVRLPTQQSPNEETTEEGKRVFNVREVITKAGFIINVRAQHTTRFLD